MDGKFSLAILVMITIVAFSFYKLGFARGFAFFKNSMKESVRIIFLSIIEKEIEAKGDLHTLLKKVGKYGGREFTKS